MDLRDTFRILKRSTPVMIALPLVAAAGAGVYSARQTPLYQASTSVYVATQQASSASDLNAGGIFTQQVVKSYADLAEKPIVLNQVIQQLGLDTTPAQLATQVSVEAPVNTTVLDISALDPSPQTAAKIADATSEAIQQVVPTLSPQSDGKSSTAVVKITPVGAAPVPTDPVTPKPLLNVGLALVAGLALAAGIAFLRDALNQKIRASRDVELVTDTPIIGQIMKDPRATRKPLVVSTDPRSPFAETYRTLRTNLQFFDFGDRGRSMVITSAQESEGKSTTAANLAIAMADAGERVVLVEADLRRPKVNDYLGIDRTIGLTDVLIGRLHLDEALQRWGTDGLAVLPAGRIPPNPSELLQSPAMVKLIADLESRFDAVIFDAPPLLPVTDAAILGRRTAGALLVTAARRTTRPQLQAAERKLRQVDARVLGIVMTMLPARGIEAETYGAKGYYGASAAVEIEADTRPATSRPSTFAAL